VVVDGFLEDRVMGMVSWSCPDSQGMEDMLVERPLNAMARGVRKLFGLNPESLEC
tara:strand:+ start:351 stop:515 length:165 start_codon:yes stop_codon:yes gene_type:complete